ncbi:hypothetical protein MRX96_044137 [Rhipicephalus microplus]
MAASITPLGTAPHDCGHAHDQDPRLRTLSTVGGYAIYPAFVVFWLLRWLCTSQFTVILFVFRGGRSARHEERHYGTLSTTSGGPDAMVASNGDPDANLLIRQKQHHKRAFDFDSKALKNDEDNGNLKVLAIDLYRKCIEELQKGLAIDFSQGKSPSWERAHMLIDKIKVNLVMAKDRTDFFEGMVKIENLGDDSRCHARVARPEAE